MAKTPKAKAEKPAAEAAPKYGVTELSEILGIEGASTRVRLRKSALVKVGSKWGWNTKAELDEAAKLLKTAEKPAAEPKAKKAKAKTKADA